MKTKSISVSFAVAALCAATTFASPLGTAFTYQGRLSDGAQPANGNYDILFSLMDAPTNGSPVGPVMPIPNVPVHDGYFTVELDFGANAFNGSGRWLDIGVRTNCNCLANYTLLSPRQPLNAAPYAQFALNAAQAATATAANTAASVAWTNITGLPSAFADGVDNDTTYAAGPGLSLGGTNNQFSVNFAGAGSANTAAHSDHNHFGAVWGGNVSFGLGLSVTNAANNAAGLFGQQGTGSGFPYIFGNTAGVWGESSQGSGVYGASGYVNGAGVRGIAMGTGGYGVHGHTLATNGTACGVYGQSDSPSGVGVFASGSGTTGTALKISNGAIRVTGAGNNSSTPAFIHMVTSTNGYYSVIDNPYCNNDPNAMLFVMPNWGTVSYTNYTPSTPKVFFYYDNGSLGYANNRWVLEIEDYNQTMEAGAKYNVLVIKP